MYPFSDVAVHYTVSQLFEIAGISLGEDSKMTINRDTHTVTVMVFGRKKVILSVMQNNEIERLFKRELQLQIIPSFDSKESVPVYMTNNKNDFATISDNELIINADIITISFIMLSRFEETLVVERDQHDRYEYKNSLSCKYNFIDIPIVDEYAMLLRKWISKYIPTLEAYNKKGKIFPTHDIDVILRFGSLLRNIKTIIGGDLLKRKSFSITLQSLEQYIATVKDKKNDPLIISIIKLIQISKEMGLCSHFHFKGLRKGQKDCTYDVLIPEIKYCMEKINEAGMVVGMHGGLDSYNNELIFMEEKLNLENVYGNTINENRQHFLKFDINKTLEIWQNGHIEMDSTIGYAEREGFRCGTCHEYYLFDLKNDRVSTVKERPLTVMEVTLFEYRGLSLETALTNMEKLYKRCEAVGGNFVILWHNENLFRDYKTKFNDVYCKFLERNS